VNRNRIVKFVSIPSPIMWYLSENAARHQNMIDVWHTLMWSGIINQWYFTVVEAKENRNRNPHTKCPIACCGQNFNLTLYSSKTS